jgi:uncharacterized tellurite resistance protein B-like protein
MPRTKSYTLKQVLAMAGVALVTVSGATGSAFWAYGRATAAMQKHLDEDDRRDERIRVLEQVACAASPLYCSTLYYKGK